MSDSLHENGLYQVNVDWKSGRRSQERNALNRYGDRKGAIGIGKYQRDLSSVGGPLRESSVMSSSGNTESFAALFFITRTDS